MDDGREREMRAGSGIGGADLEIELRGRIRPAKGGDRTEAHRCLSVLAPEIVEGRAPAMRHQPLVGNHARRGEGDDRRQVAQHPGDEGTRDHRHAVRTVRIIGRRPVRRVAKAEMDMDPVADGAGLAQRREADRPAQSLAGRARDLAQHRRLVGDGDGAHRLDRHLELVWAVFAQEGIGGDPGGSEGGDQHLAKVPLGAKAGECVTLPLGPAPPWQVEFVLEGAEEAKAGRGFEPLQCLAQNRPGAAFPWPAVQMQDIAEHEILDRPVIAEVDPGPGRGIGNQHKITQRAIRAVGDGVETGDLNIGRGPADSAARPAVDHRGGEPLAPQLARDVARAEIDQAFRLHALLPFDRCLD